MKTLVQYIDEAFRINKDTKVNKHDYDTQQSYTLTSKTGLFKKDEILSKVLNIVEQTDDAILLNCYSYYTKDTGLCQYSKTSNNTITMDTVNKRDATTYNEFKNMINTISDKEIMFLIANKNNYMDTRAVYSTVTKINIYATIKNLVMIVFEIL